MENLWDHAPCGFLSFFDDGTIIKVNRTLTTLLEYENENLEGQSIESILTLASRIFYNTHFFPLIRLHGKAEEIFLSLLSQSKKDIPVLVNAVRIVDGDKYVILCIFIPVYQRQKYEQEILSAKKLAEDALKQNEELTILSKKLEKHAQELDRQHSKALAVNQNLVQFNKIISHDLQEPIRKIRLFVDQLSLEGADTFNRKSLTAIQRINTSLDKLNQLTTGLDQFIKVDTEKTAASVDLNHVLNNAKKKAAAENKFTDFDFRCDRLPVILGYETPLELLFYHLVDNAIRYRQTPEKLVITINAILIQENSFRSTQDKYKYTDHVKITFSDNGQGFANKYKEYVFDLVTKIDPQTTGLGLGLSLCKKIVDHHAGKISVVSEIGKGTTFTILLPVNSNS